MGRRKYNVVLKYSRAVTYTVRSRRSARECIGMGTFRDSSNRKAVCGREE